MCPNNQIRYRNKITWIFQRNVKKSNTSLFSRGKSNSLASKQPNKLFIGTYAHFSAWSRLRPATTQVQVQQYLATQPRPRLEHPASGCARRGQLSGRSCVPFVHFPHPAVNQVRFARVASKHSACSLVGFRADKPDESDLLQKKNNIYWLISETNEPTGRLARRRHRSMPSIWWTRTFPRWPDLTEAVARRAKSQSAH